MDPAGPSFGADSDLEGRLDPTDAEFVDAIHCNGGKLGSVLPVGHANFYPNGGLVQPGCSYDLSGIHANYAFQHVKRSKLN